MRIYTRDRKLVIAAQCARVGCDQPAESELPVEKVGALVEALDGLDPETELSGGSSTLGLADRVKAKSALALIRQAARALDQQLQDGIDATLELPWLLRPSIFCDSCSAELLAAVGDDVAEWWDHREGRE